MTENITLQKVSAIPQVSVAIAAYNCASFVDRAIQSALNQHDVPVELVIVNDCSTDDTAEVLAAWAARDARIRVFDNPRNLGPSGARNRAFDEARGEWIAVLDADDALPEGALVALLAVAAASDADIVSGNFEYYDAKLRQRSAPAFRTSPALQQLDLPTYLRGAQPGNDEPDLGLLQPLFRRSFLEGKALRYRADIRHGEDFHLIVDALCAGASYFMMREQVTYLYTTRESGFSRTQIDYGRMIRESQALLTHPQIRTDARAVKALREGVRALQRFELDRLGSLPSEDRPRSVILRKSLQSRAGIAWLIRRFAQRLGWVPFRATPQGQ